MSPKGYVYMLTTASNTLIYTGSTSNLQRRITEHKNKRNPASTTAKYNCSKLVYVMEFPDKAQAYKEEFRIKAGSRKAKIAMINSMNPEWRDLWNEVN